VNVGEGNKLRHVVAGLPLTDRDKVWPEEISLDFVTDLCGTTEQTL
jgi:hypothetical protein